MAEPVLSARQLNRALLARQLLLERADLSLTAAVEQIGGLQTQYAPSGYIGLWSRLRHFQRPALTRALEDRTLVQGTLMRVTIHTVSAADYWAMVAGVRAARRAWFLRAAGRRLDAVDMEKVSAAVREELAHGPLRMIELTERIAARGFPKEAMDGAGLWVDLVRVPPSGTWKRRRADLYGLADQWLGSDGEVSEDEGRERLVRRYLGAYGPAPLRDVASWAGLSVAALAGVPERMELRTFRGEDGRRLLDLPDAPLPAPDAPAPVRFLASFEPALLVHARRTQVLSEEHRPRIFSTKNPHWPNTFLVDGQVAGTWRVVDQRIQVEPFAALPGRVRAELDEEAERLAAFHAG